MSPREKNVHVLNAMAHAHQSIDRSLARRLACRFARFARMRDSVDLLLASYISFLSPQSPFPPLEPAVALPLARPSRSSLPVLPVPGGGVLSVPGLRSKPLPSSLPAPSSSSIRSAPSDGPPILGVPGLASRLTQPSIAAAAFSRPRPWPAPLGVAVPLLNGRMGPSSTLPTSSVIEICADSPPMRDTEGKESMANPGMCFLVQEFSPS
jgi:hypothetical protein